MMAPGRFMSGPRTSYGPGTGAGQVGGVAVMARSREFSLIVITRVLPSGTLTDGNTVFDTAPRPRISALTQIRAVSPDNSPAPMRIP